MSKSVYLLEMTSPSQLVPGRTPPAPLELKQVGPAEAPVVTSTYHRIGAPLGWAGRMGWSDAQWEQELSVSGTRAWIAVADENVAGLIELEVEDKGDVGIVVFGLVPELVGRGFGGALLTMATELAWTWTRPDGTAPRRVWVQTSSLDHPHALPNYQARGFRIFRTKTELPTDIEGLVLRSMSAEDAGPYHTLIARNRDHLTRYGDYRELHPATAQSASEDLTRPDDSHRFGVWLGDELIGRVDLVPREAGNFVLGYWLDQGHTGHGYATEACVALIEYGRSALQATDVWAGVTKGNAASEKVLKRLGFRNVADMGSYTRFHRALE